jgi:glycolate oxidase iron-sulfur subunit
VARGRVHLTRLLLEGKYDFTKDREVAGKVDACLLCGACVAACPAEVRTDDIMVAARSDFAANRGLRLFHRLVYGGLLSRQERLARVSALLRLYERTGARGLLYGKTLRRALSRLVYFDSFLPGGLSRPARAGLGQALRPAGKPRIKVAYFLGCASNVFWAPTVRASVAYLLSRGAEVSFPPTGCCGEPHRGAGDLEGARALGLGNSGLIFRGEFEAIVTDCPTCARALRRYDWFVGADSREGERVRGLAGKVMELNSFVAERLGIPAGGLRPVGHGRVTYHDPCHAVRGLGVREAPRAILSAIPGLGLAELDGADSCCGGAGAYGFTHPAMSGRIAAGKAARIARGGADLVSTSCPACALQLGAGLKRAGHPLPVRHPVGLLAASAGLCPGGGEP